MSAKKRIYAALCALAVLACPHARAQESVAAVDSERAAQEIFGEFMSPFCPGRLLRDCPSGAAHDLKQSIRSDFESGKTKADVEARLVALYGNEVWASPSSEGFGIWAWITPVLFVALGLAALGAWLRVKRTEKRSEPPAPEISREVRERIERELER